MKNVYVVCPEIIGTISPEIYGHFTEHIGGVIYDGIWVGRNSKIPNIRGFRKEIIDRLREIKAPVLRWPGGCFAETYNWRDGIGPNRPIRISWWTKSDGRYEPNAVGTHEFMDFCSLVGAKAYFAANLTSSTPMEIRNWMDYCLSPEGTTTLSEERKKNGSAEPFKIPFWGIGNENWGGGGNMTGENYANEFRRYSAIMDNTSDNLCLIACGPNGADYRWTHDFLNATVNSDKKMGGLSLHYYCGSSGDPLEFTEDQWYQQLLQAMKMEEILLRHWNIIKGFGMEKYAKLVVDEWGCWHPEGSGPSKGRNLFEQQSTIRDAAVTALTLNIFNNQCDKVRMANVAQLVNNLHSLFLSEGKNCIVTPTYHVFHMYKGHQGGIAVRTIVEDNRQLKDHLSVSASVKNGKATISLVNFSAVSGCNVRLNCIGKDLEGTATMTVLANQDLHAHNTFENPDCVTPHSEQINVHHVFSIPKGSIAVIEANILA